MKSDAGRSRSGGDGSFVHHRKEMMNLVWKREPKSVAVFVTEALIDSHGEIEDLKHFLEGMQLRVTMNEYKEDDLIILVGADNDNLTVSSLFQDRPTPPVLSITPGRQGFISFVDFCSHNTIIPQIIRGNCFILPRCRLRVEYHSLSGLETFVVLNDLTVNRNPLLRSLGINCSSNDLGFSQIQGDGVIIATPTGSTAYNKAAGGALVHPLLSVFMLTPICAFSLSARPILFPHSANLTISLQELPGLAKEAIVSFDGSNHRHLKTGEKLVISVSPFEFQSILMNKSVGNWLVRLAGTMGWNDRKHQKPLPKK